MSSTIVIYCDESSHLENDGHPVMVLGALWCSADKRREIAHRIREIKGKNNISPHAELKWTKVNPAKSQLYLDVIDYFFDDDDLHFRALVADKFGLNHDTYDQSHDEWYYKMYFQLLAMLLGPRAKHHIFIDIKDTQGAEKARKLHEILCNNAYDFERKIIQKVQVVRSHEVEQLQMADLLIGCINYAVRGLETSDAKVALVERVKERSGYTLTKSTLYKEKKFNLFFWQGRRA